MVTHRTPGTPDTSPAVRVLVVDDDEANRQVIRFVVEDAGYPVDDAATGADALDQLRRCQDRLVVLLDLRMPEMDGVEVLQAVDAEPSLATHHAYIVLTASVTAPSPELADLLTRLQADFLAKPFDVDTLLDYVAAAARRLGHRPPTRRNFHSPASIGR